MSETLFDSLERMLETEPFVIGDTCIFDSNQGYGKPGFLEQTYDFKEMRSVPLDIIEREKDCIEWAATLTQKPNIHVTQQIYNETERKVSKIQQTVQFLQRKISCRHKRITPNETTQEEQTSPLASELAENAFTMLKQLKQKILHFKDSATYETLFKFFAELGKLDPGIYLKKKQKMQNTKNPYFFGDESIAAAIYYRALTGQGSCTTAATTDHDIKKLVRTAHILFETIDEKKLREKTGVHRCQVYLPERQGEQFFYRPYLDTELPQSMGTLTRLEEKLGKQAVNRALELAYDTFNRIC
ncbi:hypothetical protein HY485_03655 [Candidatus Woesearchaeota archaeon]|nr:hypothetical protein [Candidatus Woesearchaeota archaeon]